MSAGPRMRDLKLGKQTAKRRRIVKLTRHDKHGRSRLMVWCAHCQKFSISIETHQCGRTQP